MQGANIFSAAIAQLEQGVSGLPKLTDATDVLLSGDSAGATGARHHLDRLATRLRASNPNTRVRGQFEATFNPDLNGKQGFPAGDPRDPVHARSTAEFNRIHVEQRNSQLDDSCLAAHPDARYLCVDDGYLALNHLTTPFFQMIDFQDPLMFNGFRDAGVTVTQAQFAQRLFDQTSELLQIRNTALDRAQMTQAPGVGGRNCAVHVMYGDDDGFLGKRVRSGPTATAYSYYNLLWNWLNGLTPSAVLAPRAADSPENPPEDSVCTARAASAPAQPAIATASSASYDFTAPLAPESIVVTFGSNLASASATATTIPWPTTLGGTQVIVTDSRGTARQAPIYYVSPGQIMYLIPAGTALGTARIAIGQPQLSVEIAATSPAIYSASATGKGVAAASYIRVTARGVRTDGLVFNPETVAAVPIPAAAGDQIFLILYGTGLRGGTATATVGELSVPVAGPVAQGTYPGLDQINLGPLPLRIGAGSKQVVIRQGDRIANIVTVTFQAAP